MKKTKNEEIRKEYKKEELGSGIRGKYYKEYMKGTNLILLSPDVAQVFHDDLSVNEALRNLMKVAQESVKAKKRSKRNVKQL